MSASVIPTASRTTAVPSTTSTWHVGLAPNFPSSLVLSNDAAIESLIMDIPFLSVGLLGFGVITFFFAMRKFNRQAFYVFASVIIAFAAGVLDVGQVLIRGAASTQSDSKVSSVLPILIARELALAFSIGIRFFFFWSFVSRPPRGERPLIRTSQGQKPSLLRMESDVYSGSWTRWGFVGGLLKYTLLLATIAVPVLSLIWRLSAEFSKFGPVYNADGGLEIVLSALFILKLFVNVWLSPLTPRWKTLRDYSPVIAALLLGLGVGIGNVLCFQFSETSLGRLLQAVELYILVLYILISSFYHLRPNASAPDGASKLRSTAPTPFEGIPPSARLSSFRITPPSVSTPDSGARELWPRTGTVASRRSNRMSSWLVPDAEDRPDAPRRTSTAQRLTSWLTNRRASGRRDREESRLWNKDDVERGISPTDEKTGYAASPDASPMEPRETTTWKDPVYSSVVPSKTASQRLEMITTALDAPPSTFKGVGTSPDGTISSFNVDTYRTDFLPPSKRQNPPGSPVYGLDGIVRYDVRDSSQARPESAQSSGMESLLRQQAELDKSVAELQMFSPTSRASGPSTVRLSVPGGQPESFRSEFSLSNFPEPPPVIQKSLAEENTPRGSRVYESTVLDGESVLGELPFTARPPRIPVAAADSTRQLSFPSTTRWSNDSGMLEADPSSRAALMGSGGTQYDVTSFIGDLTTPGLKVSFSESAKQERPISKVIEQEDSMDVPVNEVEQTSELTLASLPVVRMQAPPPALVPAGEASTSTRPLGQRRFKQGLPRRPQLNISGPIPRVNMEKSTAYERPRPVPLP